MGDFDIGDYARVVSTDDGRALLEHIPTGETLEIDEDGVSTEGAINASELSTETLENVTDYIGPNVPVSEINSRLQSMDAGEVLFLRNGDYTSDTTLEVPDNKGVTANRHQARIVVDDETVLNAYDEYAGTESDTPPIKAAVTNQTRTDAQNVTIENLYVQYTTAETEGAGNFWSGVWLHDVGENSAIRGCKGEDVMPDAAPVSNERAWGVLVTDCERTSVEDLTGINCGYEGLGFRGSNVGISASKLKGLNNATHSMQIAGMTRAGTVGGRPKDVSIHDVVADSSVIHHGSQRTDVGASDETIVIENVSFVGRGSGSDPKVKILEWARGGVVRDVAGRVDIEAGTDETIKNLTLENVGWNESTGFTDFPVGVEVTGEGALIDGITIRDTALYNDRIVAMVNRSVTDYQVSRIRVENCSLQSSGTAGGTSTMVEVRNGLHVDDLTVVNSWADTSRVAWTSGGGSADKIRVYDNDLRDVNDIAGFTDGDVTDGRDNLGFDPTGPADLSTVDGYFDGQQAVDDGTNTVVYGTLCVWDHSAALWRPANDPDTGAF